jgi:F-type H+-transporting ATPase subunit b
VEFDWTTFSLEIINFLILVWILKRFLYRPILDVIAKRRQGIENSLAEAKRIEAEALNIKQQNEKQLVQWGHEREAAEARLLEELATERTKRMAALEAEIEEERQRGKALAERHQREFEHATEEKGISQGAAFSAKLLARVASPELEARLYTLLIEDLNSIGAAERNALVEAAAAPSLQVTVRSAFTLEESRRAELARAMEALVGKKLTVEYQQDPSLLAGFQLNVGPWILHANLRDELKFFRGVMRHAG